MMTSCVFAVLAGGVLSASPLVPNELGAPQDLQNVSGVAVCANRSSYCNVMLDVPAACASASAAQACPVLFCLHGFGGSNRVYVDECGSGVHAHGFIGVYPQGDPLAGTEIEYDSPFVDSTRS